MTFKEDINKFTHEVEETFKEVKEHVILAVEQHSLLIALGLMVMTTSILVIGTLYVWCFHHPSRTQRSTSGQVDKKKKIENGPKENNCKNVEKNDEKENPETIDVDSHVEPNESGDTPEIEEPVLETDKEDEAKSPEVRKRIPSNSANVNNNESPSSGKSRIPVRRSISRTKQS